MVALQGKIEQHKGEFIVLRAAMVVGPILGARVEVSKSKPFAGSRSTKDMDNFV